MGTTIDLDLVEYVVEIVCECEIARTCSKESSLVNETPSALQMTTKLKELHRKLLTTSNAIVGSQLRIPLQTMMSMSRVLLVCFSSKITHL